MGRSTRKELIRLRHEKMAGREKQSADEVTSCICLVSGSTRPEAGGDCGRVSVIKLLFFLNLFN